MFILAFTCDREAKSVSPTHVEPSLGKNHSCHFARTCVSSLFIEIVCRVSTETNTRETIYVRVVARDSLEIARATRSTVTRNLFSILGFERWTVNYMKCYWRLMRIERPWVSVHSINRVLSIRYKIHTWYGERLTLWLPRNGQRYRSFGKLISWEKKGVTSLLPRSAIIRPTEGGVRAGEIMHARGNTYSRLSEKADKRTRGATRFHNTNVYVASTAAEKGTAKYICSYTRLWDHREHARKHWRQ